MRCEDDGHDRPVGLRAEQDTNRSRLPRCCHRHVRPACGSWSRVLIAAAGAAAYLALAWRPRPAPPRAASSSAPVARIPRRRSGRRRADHRSAARRERHRGQDARPGALESPAVMAWLPTHGLIRNFTVAVANIADGGTPARHLGILRPTSPFRIVGRDGNITVDPRSYERYGVIADAVLPSLDPAGAAQLYATPQAAHRGSASRSGIRRSIVRPDARSARSWRC